MYKLKLDILQHADNAQQVFSSDNVPTLHYEIPTLEALHQVWSSWASHPKFQPFTSVLYATCEKIDEYYEKTTKSSVYIMLMSMSIISYPTLWHCWYISSSYSDFHMYMENRKIKIFVSLYNCAISVTGHDHALLPYLERLESMDSCPVLWTRFYSKGDLQDPWNQEITCLFISLILQNLWHCTQSSCSS